MKQKLSPPIPPEFPKKLSIHNHTRHDPFYGFNDRENPEVINYLNQENDYCTSVMIDTEVFQKQLFDEMKCRIKEEDSSVPYFFNGYYYIKRFKKGKEYPIYSRKKASLAADEEILLDVNVLAEGKAYCHVAGLSVSPDNRYLAYGVDFLSRRIYSIHIKDLTKGENLERSIINTTGSAVWANDNRHVFFTRKDEITLRSDRIFRTDIFKENPTEQLVFEEKDSTYHSFIYKSKSQAYLILGSSSTLTTEYRILDANTPEAEFKVFSSRIKGLEYGIAHYAQWFYILTNKNGAKNFKLMRTSVEQTDAENWEEVIAHDEQVLIEDFEIFKDYLVVSSRSNGLNRMQIIAWDGSQNYFLPFESETYTAATFQNPEFDTHWLRYSYSDMLRPASVMEFNMQTSEVRVLKTQEIPDVSYDDADYFSERVWATADDGTKIPVSMVYPKSMKKNAKNPLLLYAYGSYGATIDPYFSVSRLSLLQRGFIYAIAHVRGGEYLGRQWYEDGKLLKKKNTFTDFIAVAKMLIHQKYTNSEHLFAMGGSAGGLLMGAIMNAAPQLFKGVVAQVPFVDVITTMLDESIPLTTGEFDEWGNPKDQVYYDYILSYSPYDNIEDKSYPHLLVTTGLHDSQVQYWEPAKWVAKLRMLKNNKALVLLKTDMDSGHGGASGRFQALKEVAFEFAFLFKLCGIKS
ncbi:MAG: S9 family peptidase [Flavobacteriaceae bacterium]|nr:S9 family peptidase [Flavobacteriaceae bacterium]